MAARDMSPPAHLHAVPPPPDDEWMPGDGHEQPAPEPRKRKPKIVRAPSRPVLPPFESAWLDGFGTAPMARGSAAEIAGRLIRAQVEATGEPMVHDFGRLWRWDPPAGVWLEIDEATVTRTVRALDGWPLDESDKALRVGGGLWRDVWAALLADPVERSGFFARPAQGLVFTNGFLRVDASGARLEPTASWQRQRHAYPIAWDPDASCGRWLQALDEWALDRDAEQAFAAQFVGTALIGLAARGAKALFLLGGGRNGKSTFVDVVSGLFPDAWRSSAHLSKLGDRFTASSLFGRRLNVVADITTEDMVASGAFKGIVSGDEMAMEEKFKSPVPFRPEVALLYSFNPPRPAVVDASDGFWRRIAVIEFTQRFEAGAADEDLARKILADELPGLMAWAIAGAVSRLRNGWARCGVEALEDWRGAENPIGSWLDEVREGDGWTKAMELYTSFKRWAEPRNRMRGLGDRLFYERLEQHLLSESPPGEKVKKKLHGVMHYRAQLRQSVIS